MVEVSLSYLDTVITHTPNTFPVQKKNSEIRVQEQESSELMGNMIDKQAEMFYWLDVGAS